jgi:hypothetical protein
MLKRKIERMRKVKIDRHQSKKVLVCEFLCGWVWVWEENGGRGRGREVEEIR